MARCPWIEERLQRWAQGVTVGDGSGYPAMSVIHPNWMPPSGGQTPVMKTAPASDVRQTHRCIGRLSARLQDTVVVHYVMRPSLQDQAERLGCSVDTVHQRIERVHALMRGMLAEPVDAPTDLVDSTA